MGSSRQNTPTIPGSDKALEAYNTALIALDVLYECASEGHQGALEALLDVAERVERRAVGWRRLQTMMSGG